MPIAIVNPLTSALKRVQAFKEVTWGTPGPATAAWMGIDPNPTIKPYFKPNLFEEQRGSLQNNFYAAIAKKGGELSMKSFATYEDLPIVLESAMGVVTPGGGPGYLRTYVAPNTAVFVPQSYTVEYGYENGSVFALGSIFNKVKISAEAEKWWTVDFSGFFQSLSFPTLANIASSTFATPIQITTATPHGLITGDTVFVTGHLLNIAANGIWPVVRVDDTKITLTGSVGTIIGANTGTTNKCLTKSIADRAVESILSGTTTLAIDPKGTALGTTDVPATWMKFDLDVDTGVKALYTGGSLYPTLYVFERMKPVLTLDLLYNSYVRALTQTNFFGNTGVAVQLKSTSVAKIAEIDFVGVLADDITFYPDKNGAQYITVKLEGQYDAASLTNDLKIPITNAIAALP